MELLSTATWTAPFWRLEPAESPIPARRRPAWPEGGWSENFGDSPGVNTDKWRL